jgi:hypothetical protein
MVLISLRQSHARRVTSREAPFVVAASDGGDRTKSATSNQSSSPSQSNVSHDRSDGGPYLHTCIPLRPPVMQSPPSQLDEQ